MTRLDRAAACVAVLSLAIWVGGLIALGACAAPLVFRIVPAPLSGDAMGAVFRRFDGVAVTCAVIVLGCEAARLIAHRGAARSLDRLRIAAALGAAAIAIYGAVVLSPTIVALHAAGAVRGLGFDGLELERMHHIAEIAAKFEVVLGLFLLALYALGPRPSLQESGADR